MAFTATPASADPLTDLLDGIFRQPPAPGLLCKKCTEARFHFVDAGKMVKRDPVVASSWIASYYGGGEYLNARTASGERFRAEGFTAAHRSLPFGARLHVCLHGCATVRINDRGPAAWTGRNLDLSRGAAAAIGLLGPGVARVTVTALP